MWGRRMDAGGLQDELAQVVVGGDGRECRADVFGINGDFASLFRGVKADLFEQFFQDGVQTAGANVLRVLIHSPGDSGDLLPALAGEIDLDAVGGEQIAVLARERGLGFGEDAEEILLREFVEFHANGKAALEFGHEIAGAAFVEGAGGDEQDVVRFHLAIACLDRGPFDDGEEIALDALARNVGALRIVRTTDFVEFVEKDDAARFGLLDRFLMDGVLVHEGFGFLLDEMASGFLDGHLPAALLLGDKPFKHVLKIDIHLLHANVRKDLNGPHFLFKGEFNFPVVEVAPAEHFAKFVAGAGGRIVGGRSSGRFSTGQKEVEEVVLGALFGSFLDFCAFADGNKGDGGLDEVANHAFNIAPVVADFGILGGLNLDEGGLHDAGQTAGDFGFADAGGADHDDIFGGHIAANLGFELRPAPTITESDSDGTLGVGLANDVAVEFFNNLARR